jgi:hypothetical protein
MCIFCPLTRHHLLITPIYCVSMIFCQTPMLPIKTEWMYRSDKLNTAGSSIFTSSNSVKSKYLPRWYSYQHCIYISPATTISHHTYLRASSHVTPGALMQLHQKTLWSRIRSATLEDQPLYMQILSWLWWEGFRWAIRGR